MTGETKVEPAPLDSAPWLSVATTVKIANAIKILKYLVMFKAYQMHKSNYVVYVTKL